MKKLITLFASAAGLQAALLTADLHGFPGEYGFYHGQEQVLSVAHTGRITIDAETGEGALSLRFVVAGGSHAAFFGGPGALMTGNMRISMTALDVALLWAGLLALPDQPWYFGGDTATQVPVMIGTDCVQMGALGLGCGSSVHLMGAFYMTQRTPAFNLWLDASRLGPFEGLYSGDAVFALRNMDTTHTPEPGAWVMIAAGIAVMAAPRRRRA